MNITRKAGYRLYENRDILKKKNRKTRDFMTPLHTSSKKNHRNKVSKQEYGKNIKTLQLLSREENNNELSACGREQKYILI